MDARVETKTAFAYRGFKLWEETKMTLSSEALRAQETERGEDIGRERRESERAITYWESKRAEFGEDLSLTALDLGSSDDQQWSNRFLISVDPTIRRSSLVLYGSTFAQLMDMPKRASQSVPMVHQLPSRYVDLFLQGCTDAQKELGPVRLEGASERYDGQIEQYRAAFIPVGIKPNSLTYFAFGAFSNRIVAPEPTS
jgi:hypothetical protein